MYFFYHRYNFIADSLRFGNSKNLSPPGVIATKKISKKVITTTMTIVFLIYLYIYSIGLKSIFRNPSIDEQTVKTNKKNQ